MNKLEQIKHDLYVHGEDLEKIQWLDDVKWLVERVDMLEKVLKTSDNVYKYLAEMLLHKDNLIRDMEEEFRTLCEKCK